MPKVNKQISLNLEDVELIDRYWTKGSFSSWVHSKIWEHHNEQRLPSENDILNDQKKLETERKEQDYAKVLNALERFRAASLENRALFNNTYLELKDSGGFELQTTEEKKRKLLDALQRKTNKVLV